MPKKTRTCLSLLLLTACILSTTMLIRQQFADRSQQTAYSDAARLAGLAPGDTGSATRPPETEPATLPAAETETEPEPVWVPLPVEDDPVLEQLRETDLDALRQENPDVVGWIRIPDTHVDYPILQSGDNGYYLEHTWTGEANPYGSIFLECRNTPDFSDFNTIIYGHNMGNGSMFGDLYQYQYPVYWSSHPYVYIVTDGGVFRYEIFATYPAAVDGDPYRLSFNETKTREGYIQTALELSDIQTDIQPAITDRFLTLSTCTGYSYEYRRVVQARLVMVQETE